MFFPRRLLIIDHEPRLTALVPDAFASIGRYLIKDENRSLRAIHSARHFQLDLIFLDVLMPELDEREVARQLRSDPALQDVTVVSVTSLAANGVIGSVGYFGDYSFVAKPFQIHGRSTACDDLLGDGESRRRAKPPNESLSLVGSGSSASFSPWSRRLQ